jgi:pimeloyl-[acyl-carrier protein] methyl ester esterase
LSYAALIEMVRKQLPSSTPFVLLGESFSGPIAVAIAASAPTNLCGVILCASFVSNPHPMLRMFKRILRFLPVKKIPMGIIEKLGFGDYSNRELRALLILALSELSHETMVARLQEIIQIDVSRDLAKITLPLLYIQAKQDRLVPPSALLRIKKIQPQIEVAQIGGPHFLLQTRPELVSEKLITFFNRLENKTSH